MNLIKRLTYKNLLLNKKRSIVTIIGIMLSVALITAVASMGISFNHALREEAVSLYGNYHYAFKNVSKSDVDSLKENKYVQEVYTSKVVGYSYIDGCQNPNKPYACLMAVSENGLNNLSFSLIEGRMPENSNEVVIPHHLKTNGRVSLSVGDTITVKVGERASKSLAELRDEIHELGLGEEEEEQLIAKAKLYMPEDENEGKYNQSDAFFSIDLDDDRLIGEKLNNEKEMTFKIVGQIERPSYGVEPYSAPGYTFVTLADDNEADLTAYVRLTNGGMQNYNDIKFLSDVTGVDKKYLKQYFSVTSIDDDEVVEMFNALRDSKYEFDYNANLIDMDRIWPLEGNSRALFIMVLIICAIIMVTSIYCIKNSFNISVNEKIKQYGMLSSIGATKKQIKKSVLYEAFLLGVIGLPLGLILGNVASLVVIKIVNKLAAEFLTFEIGYSFSVVAAVFATILGTLTIYFSATGSAKRAGKIPPITAIRNASDIKIEGRSIKAPAFIEKLFGIGGVVSYKNIKRNKRKYRTTVISIVLCSVTFIVTSYFFSLGIDMVKKEVGEADYSFSVNNMSDSNCYDTFKKIASLDEIESVVITDVYYITDGGNKYTDDYQGFLNEIYGEDENASSFVTVLSMEGSAFDEYLKEIGVSKSDISGKGILVNKGEIYKQVDEKTTKNVDVDIYELKKGDSLKLQEAVYKPVYDEGGEVVDSKIETRSREITLAAVTDIRPMGYKNSNESPLLVVSRDSFEKSVDSINHNNSVLFATSKETDLLQDNTESLIKSEGGDPEDFYINNIDKEFRTFNALFTILGIFAYGFIVVIALIGITNIVNTISTSMELRSQEFATLRSVGMTTKEFNRMVRLESLFTSGKALLFGLPIGLGFSFLIYLAQKQNEVELAFHFPLKAVIINIVVVVAILYAIMHFSMGRIAKKNIIDTIKNENI